MNDEQITKKKCLSTCICTVIQQYELENFLNHNKHNLLNHVHPTSFKEFILALKCGDFSMRKAISSLRSSRESICCGHICLQINFIEANKSETLPTFCNRQV